jgi:glycosyltransferase involved in cell wall biosynthesis
VCFQNQEDQFFFSEKKIVNQKDSILLPGSGVDLQRFSLTKKKDDGTIRFLMMSRLIREKGVHDYVDAAKILKDKFNNVEFQLMGPIDTSNSSSIEISQIREWESLGLIRYLGTSDDTSIELSKADCVVLPSYYREGTPRSLLEGAAMGKAIVTTDTIGCRNTVEHGKSGFMFQPRDIEGLANCLEMIIRMPLAERKVMGLMGREKMIREFDEQKIIEFYHSAIVQILG